MADYRHEHLKPCPFCGGTDAEVDAHKTFTGDVFWSVGCPDCGVWNECASSKEEAVALWNRRISDTHERAYIEGYLKGQSDAELALFVECNKRKTQFCNEQERSEPF